MITAEQAKHYTKSFDPNEKNAKKVLDEIERKIKRGDRHVWAYTTCLCRDYAEDIASYCRSLGYSNARISDIYSNSGVRGGNMLVIDL